MASLASKALETQFNFLLRNSQILSQHVKSTRFLDRCSKIFCSSHLGERGYVTGTSIPITTTPFPEFDDVPDLKCHKDLYNLSLAKPDLFWGKLARSRISWFKDFDQVKDCDLSQGKIKWFVNGKLNVSVNCVDRHYDVSPDRVALIWEKDEPGSHEFVTYRELFQLMNRIGNLLKSHGVKKGDRVAIYLPKSPVAVASMLACARIGAVHSVVFAGFSADSLADRINDAQVETVITADQGVRGGKIIDLKRLVDEAVKKCPGVRQVFVARRTGGDVPMGKLDIPLDKALEEQSDKLRPEEMDSEDFLFLLYTSGSTGKPKGLAHTQAGYLTYTNVTHKHVFDYRPGELFGCVADIGWITGHSYVVYGPLSNGATTLLFESTPTYPDPGRYWEMTERLGLHHIYLSPTALRLLLKSGDSWVKKYDLSSLRVLGCVGEPLNHDAWEWYYNVVGEKRCDIIDTWWQTETGGICIAPRPSDPGAEIRSAMPMRPFFGIDPLLMDQKGNELMGADESGSLYLRSPWPGMARTIWGDHQRYISTYLASVPGMYLTGDGAHRVDGEFYQITGRMDDVINTTGHRLGTAELEDVVADHDAVSECAVVGFPHDIKGEGIYLYVVLKDGVTESEEDIRADINALIKSRIAGYATADMIQFSPGLPRTRSGKIMRRILRKVAANQSDELGDTSTLADPSVVEVILQNHKKIVKSGA